MSAFCQDVRYAARLLLKNPGFAIVAVATLALGIGANTAIFSVVNAVLMRPLPYHDPQRLTVISTDIPGLNLFGIRVAAREVLDLREQCRLFDGFEFYGPNSAHLTGDQEAEQVSGAIVSSGFFEMLGVAPHLGRVLSADNDVPGSEPVVVLSFGVWKRSFGGDPAILGESIDLSGITRTVVGVLGERFRPTLPGLSPDTDFWVPFATDLREMPYYWHNWMTIGRMKPGVTLAQAQSDVDVVAARIRDEHLSDDGFVAHVALLHEQLVGEQRTALLVLLGAVGFVLLIACANVATLFLSRARARQREMAIRVTLGARRFRVVRQLLTESVLVAALGGAAGLLLAAWLVDLIPELAPPGFPRIEAVSLNGMVLAFASALTLLTGVGFGLAPALQLSKQELAGALKEGARGATGGRSARRMRSGLVVAQLALSLMLLIGTGLMIRSLVGLWRVDPGFNATNVLTYELTFPRSRYPNSAVLQSRVEEHLQRVRGLPRVISAAAVNTLPLAVSSTCTSYTFEGAVGRPPGKDGCSFEPDYYLVTPDYLDAMGMSLVEGRWFTNADISGGQRVIVIDESLARSCWPNESAVGKRVVPGRFPENPNWEEVVGVVRHVRHEQLSSDGRRQIYVPAREWVSSSMTMVVRSSADPLSLAEPVRNLVRGLDRDIPVVNLRTMSDYVGDATAQTRFMLGMLSAFAAIALLLAVIGVYGVLSYSVTQRVNEIGVRMALGAVGGDIVRLILRDGVILIGFGLPVGLLGAWGLTRLMQNMLFDVSATDPATFAVVALLLAVISLLACYIPARRATRVDPMTALRCE